MPMTLRQIEERILQLEEDLATLRGSLDYQQSVLAIRGAIATVGEGKGRRAKEVIQDIRKNKAAARASE